MIDRELLIGEVEENTSFIGYISVEEYKDKLCDFFNKSYFFPIINFSITVRKHQYTP